MNNIKRDWFFWLYCPAKTLLYFWDHRELLDEPARVALEAVAAFADEQCETVTA